MNPKLAMAINNGDLPASNYHVANTREELVRLIGELVYGNMISCDSILDDGRSVGLHFCIDANGKVALATNEFIDEDEEVENQDFHIGRYETAEEAVDQFKINGLHVFDVIKGRRFTSQDFPVVF